jgi:glycosyltransferase involved in cell wall biosynthesis
MRILWLKTELLHPVDRGGRIRTYAMLKALRRQHHITYAALDNGAVPEARTLAQEYAHEVVTFPFDAPSRRSVGFALGALQNLASPLPFTVWRFLSEPMRQWVADADASRSYDVIVCDFLFPAGNLPATRQTPMVLFEHNVEAQIWKRLGETSTGWRRKYLELQWRRVARYEAAQCRGVDQVVTVSVDDSEHIRSQYGAVRVGEVPTGVDTEAIQPSGSIARERDHLVFLGAMDWLPNEDGAAFLLNDILPRVRQQRPDVRVSIVGRNPPQRLRTMADLIPGVEVTGTVPDVRPYLERASIMIVPLRIGGGTRLKILEGMAMELPVVSTTVGAEGLPLVPGEHILLADNGADFANAILMLLDDPVGADALGARGAALVRAQHGWDRAAESFSDLCEAARRHAQRRSSTIAAGVPA